MASITRDELLKLKQQGLTYAELGDRFGVSRQRVQQLIRTNNPRNGHCSRCGRYDEHLHEHHKSYSPEVVEMLCVSCHMKTNKGNSKLQRAFASSNFQGPVTRQFIREQFGCSYASTCNLVKQFKVEAIKQRGLPRKYLDWKLPNVVLAEIWDQWPSRIANLRNWYQGGEPLISGAAYRHGKHTLPDWFHERVARERAKREHWFRHGCLPQEKAPAVAAGARLSCA